jgi:hypothetical protein
MQDRRNIPEMTNVENEEYSLMANGITKKQE